MIRHINIPLEEIDYKRLSHLKGSDNWEQFIKKLAYKDIDIVELDKIINE